MTLLSSEDNFLAAVLPFLPQDGSVLLGPGDDCAVVAGGGANRLLTMDQVIADVHFSAPETTAAQVAVKLLRRNLSDIAAMGGCPLHALLSMTIGRDFFRRCGIAGEEWLTEFYRSLGGESERWGVSVCGGDIARMPGDGFAAALSLEGIGGFVTRGGGKPGRRLYCTGEFGASFASGHHLDFMPRLAEGRFLFEHGVDAMIDVTDGLLKDASRLALASALNLIIDLESIPKRGGANLDNALRDGEDYELLFTAAGGIEADWPFDTRLTEIGETIIGDGGVFDNHGHRLNTDGFDHLAELS